MDELLTWLYGRSARNAHIRKMALDALKILRKEQSLEHQELCKRLGVGFDQYKKPKRTFYSIVNPLKQVQLIQEKRVFPDKNSKKYQTHYILNAERFHGFMTKMLNDFYNGVKD